MIFASYGRKSIYSDTSDSIKNQHRMNREYADFHFFGKVDSFLLYEDEGMTGANTNRPDLKRLMKDIESGIINILIVYQLDRLSRDVRDFSNIYAFLEEHKVQFVSVKENIDTSTPIGKAMMYVSVVFAQMERETTSNRVYDNMIGLAGNGWWVGGNPPKPYHRKRITTADGKHHVTIEADESEAEDLRSMYRMFVDHSFSLQGFESYLKRQGVKTSTGKFFSTVQLHKILTMPYCVPATPEIYDFYNDKGCIMTVPRDQWDGSVGVMIYGRTTERNKKHTLQPPEKWQVCPGRHKPCIDVDLWLAAQRQFGHNIFDKSIRHEPSLLKGVLRCSCGRLMGVSRKKRVDGSMSTWYACPKRRRQGPEYCNMSQIKSHLLDQKVIDIFKNIKSDPAAIKNYIGHTPNSKNAKNEIRSVNNQISAIQSKIDNLTATLAESQDSTAVKYIVQSIEKYDKEIQALNRSIAELQAEERMNKESEMNLEEKYSYISELIDNIDSFSPEEKNAIIKDVLKKCVWDGESLFILL